MNVLISKLGDDEFQNSIIKSFNQNSKFKIQNFNVYSNIMFFQPSKQVNNFSSKGFTMIEIVTSVFLISAGIIGTFTVVQKVLNFTTINASRFTAAYLVQEGIEIVKNIKDTNVIRIWEGGMPPPSWDDYIFCCEPWPHNCVFPPCECGDASEQDYCEADYQFINPYLYDYNDTFLRIDGGFYKYSMGGVKTKFKRKIYVKRPVDIGGTDIDESEMIIVKVIVEWNQKGNSYQVEAQENLYNWY